MTRFDAIRQLKKEGKKATFDNVMELTQPEWYKKIKKEPTSNKELLADFIHYCITHKEQRFWQALRNWSGYQYIWASRHISPDPNLINTFYWTTKEGKEK